MTIDKTVIDYRVIGNHLLAVGAAVRLQPNICWVGRLHSLCSLITAIFRIPEGGFLLADFQPIASPTSESTRAVHIRIHQYNTAVSSVYEDTGCICFELYTARRFEKFEVVATLPVYRRVQILGLCIAYPEGGESGTAAAPATAALRKCFLLTQCCSKLLSPQHVTRHTCQHAPRHYMEQRQRHIRVPEHEPHVH